MADRRIRDLRRLLEGEALPYGATVAINVTGGSHLRCVFTLGDRHASVFTGLTPSCPYVHRKVAAEARRTLRSLAESKVMA